MQRVIVVQPIVNPLASEVPREQRGDQGTSPQDSTHWLSAHPGAGWLIVAAAFVVICAGIKAAAAIIAPTVLGAYIAIVDVPMMRVLLRRRVPLGLAVLLVLFADLVVVLGLLAVVVASSAELSERLPYYFRLLTEGEERFSTWLGKFGVEGSASLFDPTAAIGLVASAAGALAGMLWQIAIALIVAAFLLLRFGGALQGGGSVSHLLRSPRAASTLREVNRYIAVKTGTSMLTGVLIGLWIYAFQGELPVLFGGLAFLLNYIPNLGSFVAAVPAVALSLLSGGMQQAAFLTLGYVLVNLIVGNILEPRVMGRALGLWPLVVLLSVVFWGWLLGVTGAVLSALLTLLLKVLLLAVQDLRPLGLVLGPRGSLSPRGKESGEDLLEEALPQTRENRSP